MPHRILIPTGNGEETLAIAHDLIPDGFELVEAPHGRPEFWALLKDAEFYIGDVRFDVGVIELRVPRSEQPEPRAVLSDPPFVARLPAVRAACPRCHDSILHIPSAARYCPRCGLELPENCPAWQTHGELNLANPALAAYAHALFNLGVRYENTADGDDLAQAIRYYEKAAKIGVTAAKARLEARDTIS